MTRDEVVFEVDGVRVAGVHAVSTAPRDKPLIVALHGGLYTSRYFDVDGSGDGSFVDIAVRHGHHVVCFDRPGYGASSRIPAPENTFERQAEILGLAAGAAMKQVGAETLFLVGHSIGGMIAVTIAAHAGDLPLVGISVTGMGAVIPEAGAAHNLANLPPAETVALPPEAVDQVMFGPAWTYRADALPQAHTTYSAAPMEELAQAPRWPREKLATLAPLVTVPVHNALAEFDALWDSSEAAITTFASLFTAAPVVDAHLARATGHSIDHHVLGSALHLRQLAFAAECALPTPQE